MYIYVYICIYICMYIVYIYSYIYIYTYIYKRINMYMTYRLCLCIFLSTRSHVHACLLALAYMLAYARASRHARVHA